MWRRLRPGVFIKTRKKEHPGPVKYGRIVRKITTENGRYTGLWEVTMFPDNEIIVVPATIFRKIRSSELPQSVGIPTNALGSRQHRQCGPRQIIDVTCSICGDIMNQEVLASYPCGHALHAQCFADYHKSSEHDACRCPICRERFVLARR